MDRTPSGIPGLDVLVEGGIPKRDLILLSGECGTGKTIFGLQFLYSLAKKENGVYVSFEEEIDQLMDSTRSFGWEIEELERENRLRFLRYDPFKLEDIFEVIENNIREIKASRVVIDSISSLGIYVKPEELRRMILQIRSMLRKNSCTSILISEVLGSGLSRFGVEEFVSDGVILLHNILIKNEYKRGLSIWKMDATNHSRKIHPYEITKKGFVVYPKGFGPK